MVITMLFEDAFREGRELMAYFRDKSLNPGHAFILVSAMIALQMADDDDSPLASEALKCITECVPMFREELRKNYRFVEGANDEPKRH